MSGYLEQAAAALNSASEQTPIPHIQGAIEALSTVVAAVHQVGGQAGEQFGMEAQGIQSDLQAIGGRLEALKQRMQAAAQQIAAGGGGF